MLICTSVVHQVDDMTELVRLISCAANKTHRTQFDAKARAAQ